MTSRPVVLILVVAAFLAGCAAMEGGGRPRGVAAPPTPAMEKKFQGAEKFFYARNFPEAEGIYQSFLKEFPYNALTPKTYFRLGEIRFHEKDLRRALAYYRRSVERGIDPQWGAMAIYKQAVCYSRLGETRRIYSTLDRIPMEPYDANVGVRAASLRVSTARKEGDPLEERKGYLELIDAYERLTPSDTKIGELNWIVGEKAARGEIRQWMDAEEGEDIGRLKGWMKRFQGRSSGAYLGWKITRLYHQKGDYRHAAEWCRQYLQDFPRHEYAQAARSLLKEVDKRGEVPVAGGGGRPFVGVLLPLSGKFAVYGESALHGLECAAGIFAPCQGDIGINLLVRDTEGDPKVAARIIEEFARNEEVSAVIGPLPQLEVDQAAVVAEGAGLPLMTLSQKPGVAQAGQFIFRNFLTVADQVATVVDHACGEKRWKKFAILYPQGAGGEEYRKEFETEVDRCGGKVVARASYPPAARSLTDAVRSLKFSSAEQKVDEPAPFQALFFPDVYRRVPELIATLRFLNVGGVHLLGGAGWDHPGLLKGMVGAGGEEGGQGGHPLEGAIFVDGFFAKGSNFRTRDFVSTFQSAYGVEPTLLEAYAYDSLRLVGEALKENPEVGRADLQKILAQKRNFPGVTGTISFDDDGDARRRLIVLTVEGGEIKEVR